MRLILVFILALTPVLSAGAQFTAVQKVQKEQVVRDSTGVDSIELVDAAKVTPGEEIIYSLQFKNDGAEPAEDISLVMPVPDEVTYVEGSVGGAAATVTFSADGGETYVARGRLTIEEAGEARPATGDEITHVRWTLKDPLAPNAAGEVFYRGVLK